jgi:hypothetical protein
MYPITLTYGEREIRSYAGGRLWLLLFKFSPQKPIFMLPGRETMMSGEQTGLGDATSRYPGLLSVVSGVAASVGITRSYNAKPWKLNKGICISSPI